MTEPDEQVAPTGTRDQEWADERFAPGDRPSDEVVVDPDAAADPNVGHP